jgi:hypothetical protein
MTSNETLQRRVGYGGRKGRSAARRLKRIDPRLSRDRIGCREFYRRVDALDVTARVCRCHT